MTIPTKRLANGVDMPCIGLGTWQTDGETTAAAIRAALECGYRLFDTAAAYGNEASVGRALRESGVPRSELFVTSKLRNAAHTYQATMEAFEGTLERLGMDYLDLYLIHWPNPLQYRTIGKQATAGTWKAFEELYEAGRIRAIGVSNFMPHHLDALLETARITPMVNQLKLCPGVTQPEAVGYCREKGIFVEAYSPFGTGSAFQSPGMQALAAKYRRSVGQICLRWCLQMDFIPLPKSKTPERLRENLNIFDFELSDGDMRAISGMKGCCGEAPDPDTVTF